AEALEALGKISTLVVDKTGTLTVGKPSVTSIAAAAGFQEDEMLSLAAAAEEHSEHPLASAVVQAARTRGLTLSSATEFASVTGGGVRAEVQGRQVRVGQLSFLRSDGVLTEDRALLETADRWRREGATAIYVAVDGRMAGALAISDPIKPGAENSLRR